MKTRGINKGDRADNQAVRIERQSDPVVPQRFHQRAGTPAEHEDVASERIATDTFLHKQRQTLRAFAHVGVTGGDPEPHA
jgi:hypothetical protein